MASPSSAARGRGLLGGKYELLHPAGEGGMASVWRGRTHGEAGFTRDVAIKRVLPALARDPKFAAMFVEEARLVAELAHPHIIQIHDFGRDADGGYYIVMEWVDGLDLSDYVASFRIANEPTPWHLIAAIGIEVLRALGAAHGRRDAHGQLSPIIHRDVTPSNVMLGLNGVVKLADFGLAKGLDGPNMTQPGIVKGKVGYMAPELLRGAKAGPKTDLYSAGVVLWESLAGQRLFGSNKSDMELARSVLDQRIPPLAGQRGDLPEDLVRVVEHLMASDPEHRFERASAPVRALTTILRTQRESTMAENMASSVAAAKARLSHSNTRS